MSRTLHAPRSKWCHAIAAWRGPQGRDYQDPVAEYDASLGGSWLAAFAPVGNTGWLAIVQERRTEAIKPVEELWTIFVRWGVLLAGVFVALLILFWWLLNRRTLRG